MLMPLVVENVEDDDEDDDEGNDNDVVDDIATTSSTATTSANTLGNTTNSWCIRGTFRFAQNQKKKEIKYKRKSNRDKLNIEQRINVQSLYVVVLAIIYGCVCMYAFVCVFL